MGVRWIFIFFNFFLVRIWKGGREESETAFANERPTLFSVRSHGSMAKLHTWLSGGLPESKPKLGLRMHCMGWDGMGGICSIERLIRQAGREGGGSI